MNTGRREFLYGAGLAAQAVAGSAAIEKPHFGIVVHMSGRDARSALAKVRRLGFDECQLFTGLAGVDAAPAIREAAHEYSVKITALMSLGDGPLVWNLRDGPLTIGVVPRKTRAERVAALKQTSDLAKAAGVPAVHTHCGFIPENPNDELYRETVNAIRDVAQHCRENGQMFLCETGQETPITLRRAIQDVGLDNLHVNLDVANLILYGKGDPVGALDVIGQHVRGIHAKDGLYPQDPYGLGQEVPIGEGRVRFAEVMRKLHELGYAGPLTIEREIEGARQEADIQASRQYLQRMIDQAYV